MKVYVLNLVAEFDNDSHNEVYVYDSFEKAHKNFMEVIGEWFNEDLFDTTKPDGNSSKIWETDEYEGHYAKSKICHILPLSVYTHHGGVSAHS